MGALGEATILCWGQLPLLGLECVPCLGAGLLQSSGFVEAMFKAGRKQNNQVDAKKKSASVRLHARAYCFISTNWEILLETRSCRAILYFTFCIPSDSANICQHLFTQARILLWRGFIS